MNEEQRLARTEHYASLPITADDGESKMERIRNLLGPAVTYAEVLREKYPLPAEFIDETQERFVVSMDELTCLLDAFDKIPAPRVLVVMDNNGYCSTYDVTTERMLTARMKDLVEAKLAHYLGDEPVYKLLAKAVVTQEDVEELLDEYCEAGFDRSGGGQLYIEVCDTGSITKQDFN